MKPAAVRPVRMGLALGLVVVIASAFAVFHAGGSFAAAAPTFTVECSSELGAKAVFSWSGTRDLVSIDVYSSSAFGSSHFRVQKPARSGTFDVVQDQAYQDQYAQAQFFGLDKTGQRVLVATVETPGATGCVG